MSGLTSAASLSFNVPDGHLEMRGDEMEVVGGQGDDEDVGGQTRESDDFKKREGCNEMMPMSSLR